MSPDVCREIFLHGTRNCDLAIVEGRFDAANGDEEDLETSATGGSLDSLCIWLDIPRVVVLDAREMSRCRMPERPQADALLLDRVTDSAEFARMQTCVESLWGIPVLGGLELIEETRAAIRQLAVGEPPARKLYHALGDAVSHYVRLERLRELASQRPFPKIGAQRKLPADRLQEVTVAVAYDEAFNCYFADTLDLLELQGATVRTFSPMHDESLPEGADVIYFGCGHPESPEVCRRLAENQCMRMMLSDHVYSGGRVYAEGGGLAYLCESIELADGERLPMAGLISANARLNPTPTEHRPVEITLAQGNWLGEGWSQVRGYLNSHWDLIPTGPLTRYAAQEGHELDLVGNRRVIGSRIHLNFAAQPEFLRAFFAPHPPAVNLSAGE